MKINTTKIMSTEGTTESKHGDSSGVELPVSESQEETGKSIDRDVAVADESSREKKHKKKVPSTHCLTYVMFLY